MPFDHDPHWPVSVKGVLVIDGAVLLLRNDRAEWELPGGRLEPSDASAPEALAREFLEEVSIPISVGPLIDTWIYDVAHKRVLIITYRCELVGAAPTTLQHSAEHEGVCLAPLGDLPAALPAGYRQSIAVAAER